MAFYKIALVLTAVAALAQAQRPFYAGRRPIGFPEAEVNVLSNRFGADDPLPIEAYGDVAYVNRLEQMPLDNRPFWYINWRQYDQLRKNPITWEQKPNPFIEKI